MASKTKDRWIGAGVLSYGGKDIKYGDPIPDGIDKDRLKLLKDQGQVGEIIEYVDPSKQIYAALEVKVEEQTKEISALKETIKELESESEGALKEEIEKLKGQIESQKKGK